MEKRAQYFKEARTTRSRPAMRAKAPAGYSRLAAGEITLEQLKNWYLIWRDDQEISLCSKETLAMRKCLFDRLFQWMEDNREPALDGMVLRRYFAGLKNLRTGEPISVAYNDTIRRVFHSFFAWLIREHGVIEKNPVESLPPIPPSKRKPQQVQPFSVEQQVKLLDAAKGCDVTRTRDILLVYLLHDTGIRSTEACNVKIKDISMTDRSIRIHHGKGDRARTVFFHGLTSRALWEWYRQRGIDPSEDGDEFLFVACSGENLGGQMTRHGIYQAMKRLCLKAQINDGKMGGHRARHSFATGMGEEMAHPDVIQHLLGHSSPAMTQRYVKVSQAAMKQQHSATSTVRRWTKGKSKGS